MFFLFMNNFCYGTAGILVGKYATKSATELWDCNLSDIGAFNFTGVHKHISV